MGFVPIALEEFVRLHLQTNRSENAAQLIAGLKKALHARDNGVLCRCGEPIWVIGSAVTGNACFTCITGESDPSGDYEVYESGVKRQPFSRKRVKSFKKQRPKAQSHNGPAEQTSGNANRGSRPPVA